MSIKELEEFLESTRQKIANQGRIADARLLEKERMLEQALADAHSGERNEFVFNPKIQQELLAEYKKKVTLQDLLAEQDEPMSINKWRGILQELAQRCPPDRWADDAQEGPSPDTFECGYCCALMQLHAMSMREDHCIPIDEFPIPYIVERYEEEQGTSNCKKCRAVIKNGGDWGYCTCCYEETRAEEEQDDE